MSASTTRSAWLRRYFNASHFMGDFFRAALDAGPQTCEALSDECARIVIEAKLEGLVAGHFFFVLENLGRAGAVRAEGRHISLGVWEAAVEPCMATAVAQARAARIERENGKDHS